MLSKSTIKYIQSLQQKKFRESYGAFVAEGPKVVNELLQNPRFTVKKLYALPQWMEGAPASLLKMSKDILEIIDEPMLERIAHYQSPNQVVAVFSIPEQKEFIAQGGLILALDEIRDPGNMGTLLRIADWFGVKQMMCSPGCVDIYNPKVVQSSMGSLGRVAVTYTDLSAWIQNNPALPVMAAMMDGDAPATVAGTRDAVLMIGNEANGLSPELVSLCTKRISIERIGEAESLNAAVAAGILLYVLNTPVS